MDDMEFHREVNEGLHKIIDIAKYLLAYNLIKTGRELHQDKVYKDAVEIKALNSDSIDEEDLDLGIYFDKKNKRYIARKQILGRRISVADKNKKECIKKLRIKINELKIVKVQKPKKELNFLKLWNKWYAQNKEPFISDRTKADINLIKTKLEPFYKLNVKYIDRDMILNLFAKQKENRTKDKLTLYTRAFFNYLARERVIEVSPFNNIVLRAPVIKAKEAFTYEQQVQILENLKGTKLEKVILIYLVTGLRKKELNYIDIEKDLDIENFTLRAVNLKGKYKVKRTKLIKLTEASCKLIQDSIQELREWKNSDNVYKAFHKFLKDLNIPGSLVNCRHTFATNNFYLGNPELFISRQMGHSSSQITKDVYTSLDYHLNKDKVLKLYNNLYFQF
mgnify:FL=1